MRARRAYGARGDLTTIDIHRKLVYDDQHTDIRIPPHVRDGAGSNREVYVLQDDEMQEGSHVSDGFSLPDSAAEGRSFEQTSARLRRHLVGRDTVPGDVEPNERERRSMNFGEAIGIVVGGVVAMALLVAAVAGSIWLAVWAVGGLFGAL